ncbi:MAG: P-II family nitrogen regulator [bacterium]|jgi:nitrogen regulatory protein PII
MSSNKYPIDYALIIVIVQSGMGSSILAESKKIGVFGGTIFLGKGTIKNHLLELLGLNEAKKEIVLMVAPQALEADLHQHLIGAFHMDKPNHGVIVSLPVTTVAGGGYNGAASAQPPIGGSNMQYEIIFTVVDRGLAEEVVDTAEKAGSTGATIINARGSGIHEKSKFFGMNIEPEKEIVMIIIDEKRAGNVIDAIETKMNINQPGKGILFVLDVTKVSGLYNPER